jgi:hypothetical protein
MADIKRIDVREFREAGFLLEANRQFFHPHGLALEITRVAEGEGAPMRSMALRADEYDELCALVAAGGASAALIEKVHGAARYEIGDAWISGVWDSRDDPEGVIFAGLSDEERAKVAAVAEERDRHRAARAALFGADTDIEPVDWIPEEESADA